MAVEAGVGASFGPRSPRAAADVRFRYLSMSGLFVTYEDGPLLGTRAEPKRALATGIELRPLFLAKWFTGRYSGNAHLDLTIDSIGLELGAVFLQPDGASFGSKPGLQAGLAFELPVFPSATNALPSASVTPTAVPGVSWAPTIFGAAGSAMLTICNPASESAM